MNGPRPRSTTKTLLGAQGARGHPAGRRRTAPAYSRRSDDAALPVGRCPRRLSDIVSDVNTDQLSDSLSTLAQTFANTPPDLQKAVDGVCAVRRHAQQPRRAAANLLASANKATTVLAAAQRPGGQLGPRHQCATCANSAARALPWTRFRATSPTCRTQLKGFIAENRAQLRPALDKLNGVLTIVDNRKERLQKSIKLAQRLRDVPG